MSSRKFLFTLSFLEGGSVMACELIAAKLLAPFFGTSLYIWAAVLGLTLGGLTLGYFLGGRVSSRFPGSNKALYIVLTAAATFLIIMPFTSHWIMESTINLSLETGALISLTLFMVPPLILMGMTSPLIINLLTQKAEQAGNSAGMVYAISTLGGILYTFLLGFFIIPSFGLTVPAVVAGFILFILPAVGLLRNRAFGALSAMVIVITLSSVALDPEIEYTNGYVVHYQSEGILGQVKVVDHPAIGMSVDNRLGRGLIVNNTLQTYVSVDQDMEYSIWSWANYFPTAASIYPEGSKVLLLGLGGGTLVKQLHRLGFEVDVVEIDESIVEVSFDYFNLDRSTPIHIDDARHYVNTCNKQYDIIIYDTFLSESVPEHLLTIEGFADARKILKDDGMIMANFYGFLEGEHGRAARSVYKTFSEAGFTVEILKTPGTESTRNLIFLASDNKLDFTDAQYSEPNFDPITRVSDHLVNTASLHLEDAIVLSDSRPQLAKLYSKAAKAWRTSYNAYYQKNFVANK